MRERLARRMSELDEEAQQHALSLEKRRAELERDTRQQEDEAAKRHDAVMANMNAAISEARAREREAKEAKSAASRRAAEELNEASRLVAHSESGRSMLSQRSQMLIARNAQIERELAEVRERLSVETIESAKTREDMRLLKERASTRPQNVHLGSEPGTEFDEDAQLELTPEEADELRRSVRDGLGLHLAAVPTTQTPRLQS